MKKYLLLLALAPMALVSCSPSKAEMKKSFVTSCVTSATAQMGDPAMKPIFEKYCDCSGDKVVDKYSAKEIEEFNKMSQTDIQTKLMPVIKDCTDALTKDITEHMTKGAAGGAAQ